MKKNLALRISYWAKKHRPAAIAIIVVLKIFIGAIGLNLGVLAALEGFTLPLATKWFLAVIAAISILAYPTENMKNRLTISIFYRLQKRLDGVLVVLGFAILFFVGNRTPAWLAQPSIASISSANTPVAVSIMEKPIKETRKEILREGKWKKWLITKAKSKAERKVAKWTRIAERGLTAEEFILSLLLIFLALAAAYGLAYLSCGLACNGQEALAILVALLGLVVIIFGLIYGFRAIWRMNSKDK